MQSGTCVELTGIHTNLPDLEILQEYLSVEFGWYLALNADRVLRVNGKPITVPPHEIHEREIVAKETSFKVKVICWNKKPSSEKSFTYLLSSSNKVVHKELSSLNNKSNFFTSVYVSSPWADKFSAQGEDLLSGPVHTVESPVWRAFSKELGEFTEKVYEDFLRRFVDAEIEKFSEDGVFPEYQGDDPAYAKWKLGNTKLLVRTIYIADPTVFSSLSKKQRKIIVRLLDKLALSNENDSLFGVLDSVLDLDANSLNMLSNQLKRTTLENIISTIECLQKRQQAVDKLREVMNHHHQHVSETPDLQLIIENNTWLFGPKYETLGAEEDTFTKVAKRLRDTLKDIEVVGTDDLEDGATIAGAKRQTDLFLARKIPTLNSLGQKIYRCIIIEIKRPSIALNKKHLRQLDDYAGILKEHPEFTSANMSFELILIGRKISSKDTEIHSRLSNALSKGEMGLVTDDGPSKRYVKNWFTVLDDFELSNGFMLEKLKLQRDSLSDCTKDQLVADLQTKTA
jgi:hypothetical protein